METHSDDFFLSQVEPVLKDRATPKLGSLWKHYKGALYRVLSIGVRESTLDFEVCYSSLDQRNLVWIRPLSEWTETVTWKGQQLSRFVYHAC